jgi:hypothetical protein
MSIKYLLAKMAERLTGRKCTRCKHNHRRRCCHPDGRMFMKCWQSITKPGFEKKPPRYPRKPQDRRREELLAPGRAAAEGFKAGMAAAQTPLTPEQEHQLQKIKGVLQEAGDTARESGLLGED